ncbi:hypothetical protein BDV96DRAFT_645707 [Lophiotrema nucula]|uniref:Uncharacterized protein n=1 Tax=Lophiotrema nucula TaxID=690887 RepID=A0A6A5ZAB0_9PLEO|nr:hypothetical protein BDV96DRAFT_645707 [Lophiotrema nucula]
MSPQLALPEEMVCQPSTFKAPPPSTGEGHEHCFEALRALHDDGILDFDKIPVEELWKRMPEEQISLCIKSNEDGNSAPNSTNKVIEGILSNAFEDELAKDLAKVMELHSLRKFAKGNPRLQAAVDSFETAKAIKAQGPNVAAGVEAVLNDPAILSVSKQGASPTQIKPIDNGLKSIAQRRPNSLASQMPFGLDKMSKESQLVGDQISVALATLPAPPATNLRELFNNIRVDDDVHMSNAGVTNISSSQADDQAHYAANRSNQVSEGSHKALPMTGNNIDKVAAETKLMALIGVTKPQNGCGIALAVSGSSGTNHPFISTEG